MEMKHNARFVFVGDSITEEGRFDDPEGVGYGYVRFIRDYLLTEFPNKNIEVINRGVGGNRIIDLVARFQRDVIALKPDYVSIFIGINDVWRQLDEPELDQVYPEKFEEIYHQLIRMVQERTEANIILIEPTIYQEDMTSLGNELLKPYVNIVRDLARTYGVTLIPTNREFLKVISNEKHPTLTVDGVHMTSTGDMLIAKTWMNAFIQEFL
ncbi:MULTISPECIES: SGNH/GDSL hydrolase family protein [Bacillaceae]|uniref:SGNH/GDSL hydrolase family protein n=1 Tax=Bacillaceae TaxID=186817 RepID=UPI000A673584|nr:MULTISPECIES: SGNH/GDSL hydrolase family protein [Bacillaceae]